MAVLIEGISVITRADSLLEKFPGGWKGFEAIVPNQTLCADNEIVRVGFMMPQDVEAFIKALQKAGLVFQKDGAAVDIAVVDQRRGLTTRCDWLEFGHVEIGPRGESVSSCRLAGSLNNQIVCPPDWKYEGSLSSSHGFIPTGDTEKRLKFLRHESGVDVYQDLESGKEVFVGRPKR